jgi:hypothetical protein
MRGEIKKDFDDNPSFDEDDDSFLDELDLD